MITGYYFAGSVKRLVLFLGLLSLITLGLNFSVAQAQVGFTLPVSLTDGVLLAGAPCPSPRDSITYANIQEAVDCAEDGDTLAIAAGSYAEALTVDKTLLMQGDSALNTVIDAGSTASTVTVDNTAALTLNALTITGGSADLGGGVFTYAGKVEVIDSIIIGNSATTGGGGIYTAAGSISVLNSTIAINQPSGEGGGIFSRAGTVMIENSTISSNNATTGGGIGTQAGTINLAQVTIAENSSGVVTQHGTVNLGSTVLASNNNVPCSGTFNSSGYNVVASIPGDCVLGGDTTGNVTGVDPLLSVLRNNGGSTMTHALLEGSPALDAANAASCTATDQRGGARPQGTNCDVGAYEGIRGDCNADLQVDAGDISALTLEIFDEDGSDPISVPASEFAGDSLGCNANSDMLIDAGDVSCLVLTIFEGPGTCEAVSP